MYLTIFGKPRYLGLVVAEDETQFEKGEQLLVESSRGLEIAVVAGEVTERQEALYRSIDNRQEGQPSNDSGLQNVTFVRRALPEDLEKEDENRFDEDAALVTARQVLSHHTLNMKLVDVEYMNDRRKLFLYFTSEQRVDFRAYVRDLAREFRTRIELRQIGVRDESKVVKGLGACGRVCCCSYWLQRFMPIGIKMVKEQNLALNPTKISGLCGRLMCCMSFEQEIYHDLWKKLPSHGAKIKTEAGTWVLTGVDLASQTCSLHGPEGMINIPVTMYQELKETLLSGAAWSNEEHGLDEKGRPLQEVEDGFLAACGGKGCGACAGRSQRFAPARPVAPISAALPKKPRAEQPENHQKDGDPKKPHHRRRTVADEVSERTRNAAEIKSDSRPRRSSAQTQHNKPLHSGQTARKEPRGDVPAAEKSQPAVQEQRDAQRLRRTPRRVIRRNAERREPIGANRAEADAQGKE